MATQTLRTNNSLEKFKQLIPGQKGVPKDIDSKLNASGDFNVLNGIDAIVKGVSRILLTSSGTYVFDPEYGVPLYKYLYEPADETTREKVLHDVNSALHRYEGRAKITTNLTFLSNKKGFRLDIVIKYDGKYKKLHLIVDETYLRNIDE